MGINANVGPIPQMFTANAIILDKKFLKTFPVFHENLHCAQKWPKILHGKILKSYPLAKWPSMEISVLFHSFAYLTLPFRIKRIPVHFSSFPGKFTLYTKKDKNYIRKILKSYLLAKKRSMEISVLFHSFAHLTPPFWIKGTPENFSSFPGKFTFCAIMAKN